MQSSHPLPAEYLSEFTDMLGIKTQTDHNQTPHAAEAKKIAEQHKQIVDSLLAKLLA
jgi:hypothetical protein